VAHEKPARRLVDQRGRKLRTVYRKLNANAKYLMVREGAENYLLVRQCTFVRAVIHAMQLSGVLNTLKQTVSRMPMYCTSHAL
jgi:hypothetical protein